jgi:hypothetical protein
VRMRRRDGAVLLLFFLILVASIEKKKKQSDPGGVKRNQWSRTGSSTSHRSATGSHALDSVRGRTKQGTYALTCSVREFGSSRFQVYLKRSARQFSSVLEASVNPISGNLRPWGSHGGLRNIMLSSLATIAVEKEMDFKKELRGRDSIVLSVSTMQVELPNEGWTCEATCGTAKS